MAYEPTSSEVYPNAKRLAAAVAQSLTTYDLGEPTQEIAAAVTDDRDRQQRLAEMIAPLVVPGRWSRGEIVYPQLGGVRPDRVSVMVVVSQRLGAPDMLEELVTRTLDVRLRLEDEQWAFDAVASVGGTAEPRPPDLTPLAAAVVDHERIELPDSAVWDIYRGGMSAELLETMLALAERTSYAVAVISSGHPDNVFGTDRLSNHSRGRAVDVYKVGSTRVIDDRDEGSTTYDVTRWLYEQGVTELGSPWNYDGFGGRSFTDVVHEDHLHIGLEPQPDRAGDSSSAAATEPAATGSES